MSEKRYAYRGCLLYAMAFEIPASVGGSWGGRGSIVGPVGGLGSGMGMMLRPRHVERKDLFRVHVTRKIMPFVTQLTVPNRSMYMS
jgi:hypothetical protein